MHTHAHISKLATGSFRIALIGMILVLLSGISIFVARATHASTSGGTSFSNQVFGDDDGEGDFGGDDSSPEVGGNSIVLTARDANGTLLPEVSVLAFCGSSFDEQATNVVGVVTLTGLTAGNCIVQLNSNYGYYSDPKNLVIPVTDADATQVTTSVVGRATDAMVTINVTDSNGAPIADGMLGALMDGQGRRFGSSSQGGQLLIRVFYGTHTLVATPADGDDYFEAQTFEVTADPSTQEVNVQLQAKTSTITGRVVDGNGAVVSTPFVILFSENGIDRSMANSSGVFTSKVRPGTYTVKTDKSGYANAAVQNIVVAAGANVDVGDIQLGEAGNSLALQLVDANGADMTTSGMVFCQNSDTPNDPASKYFSRFTSGAASFSFPDGTFACTPMVNGFVATSNTTFEMSGASTVSSDVTLQEYNATVTVNFIDQLGNAVTDGDFGVTLQSDNGVSINGFNYDGGSSVAIEAIGGTYSVRPFVQSGAYVFPANASTSVTVADNGTAEVTVTAYQASGTVSGTITNASGTVVNGAKVRLMSDEYELAATTNSDGAYSVNVVPGTYTVQSSADGAGMPSEKVSVTVADNATEDLDEQFQASTATFTVTAPGDPDSGSCYGYKDDGMYVQAEIGDDNTAELDVNAGDWTYGCRTVKDDSVQFTVEDTTKTVASGDAVTATAVVAPIEEEFNGVLYQFSSGSDAAFTMPDGTEVFIPAGSLDTSSGNVSIIASTATDVAVEGALFPAHAIELKALDANSNPIEGNFNNSISITFHYNEEDLATIGIDENELKARTYKGGSWAVTNSGDTVDTENNTVSVSAKHFSSFGILGVKGDPEVDTPAKIGKKKIKVNKRKRKSAKINWPDVSGATYYKLMLAKKKVKKGWKKVKTKKNLSQSKVTLKKLKQGKRYRVKVSGCNTGGCGAWSAWIKFKTKQAS